jgi:hypothetical protein
MTPPEKPEYLTKEQIVRGTIEARRLVFDALSNECLCSLTEPRYRTYGAWWHTNHQGFSGAVRICFYLDPHSPPAENTAAIDVSHDMYFEMLDNPIDEMAKELLSKRFFHVCPPRFEKVGFTVEFHDYTDDDAIHQIVVRILDSRLTDWRSRFGSTIAVTEAPWGSKRVDYVVRERRGKWHIDPCGAAS